MISLCPIDKYEIFIEDEFSSYISPIATDLVDFDDPVICAIIP